MSNYTVEEVLRRDGRYIATPVGVSMWPMLRSRTDTVLLVPADTAALRRGDVILYRRPTGKMVLHRIRGKDAQGFILCGDNQGAAEHGVQAEWIIGVMKGFFRKEKYVPAAARGYRAYTRLVLWTHPLRAPFLRLRDHVRRRKGASA